MYVFILDIRITHLYLIAYACNHLSFRYAQNESVHRNDISDYIF